NSYGGTTNINTGATLVASHATAGVIDVAGSSVVTLNGGTFRSALTASLNNDVTFSANSTGTLAAATGTVLTLGGGVVTYGNNSVATFNPASDTGTIVVANGNLPNVFTSAQVVVAGGTLRDGDGSLGDALGSIQSTTVAAGAILDANDQGTTIHNLIGS